MGDGFDQNVRAAVRQSLVDAGLPRQHVDEIADLAVHASAMAIDTLRAVVARASSQLVSMTVIGIAASITRTRLDVLEEAVKSVAAAAGLKVQAATISVGGHNHG